MSRPQLNWIPAAGMQPGRRLECLHDGRRYVTTSVPPNAPKSVVLYAELKTVRIVERHANGAGEPLRLLSDGSHFLPIDV